MTTYDGAIVLMHGIGRQKRGETLKLWARAVEGFVRQSDGVTISCASRRRSGGDGAARYEEWTIVGDGISRTWLVIESWWAQSFSPPPPAVFVRWLGLVVPRLLICQLWAAYSDQYRLFSRDWRRAVGSSGPRWGRAGGAVRLLLVGAAFNFSLAWRLLAALLLVLASLLAWGASKHRRLGGGLALLIAYLGDSLAAVAQERVAEDEHRKMLQTIRSDIGSCLVRTRPGAPVVVVAHSQGAMLAREVLAEMDDPRTLLRSVGAGIAPLTALRRPGTPVADVTAWATFAALGVLAVVDALFLGRGLVMVGSAFGGSPPTTAESLGALAHECALLGLVFVLVASVVRVTGMREWLPSLRRLGLPPSSLHEERWVEFSAYSDPVSCGPVLREAGVLVVGTANPGGLLQQHSSYHLNPVVLASISELLGASPKRNAQERSSAWTAGQLRKLRVQVLCLLSGGTSLLIWCAARLD